MPERQPVRASGAVPSLEGLAETLQIEFQQLLVTTAGPHELRPNVTHLRREDAPPQFTRARVFLRISDRLCQGWGMKIYRLSQAEFRAWRDHDARAELSKRIFTEHGVAQVRAPSGRVLGTARQTGERIPIERAKFRAAHHAIRPGECMCREWQKPPSKEDEHHPICAHKAAWESQQVHDADAPRERAVVSETAAHQPESADPTGATEPPPPLADAPSPSAPRSPTPSVAPPARPKPLPASTVPEPGACVCHIWAGGISGQHHPLCQFKPAWERERGISKLELVELETGEVVREATPEEAAASKRKEPEDGVGAINFGDGKLYYVRTG